MIYLYNIDDGLSIVSKKKKINTAFIICGLLLVGIIIFITCLSNSYLIMALDILLVTAYLWTLYTYIAYYKRVLNVEYHLLAKIEQYEHNFIEGKIEFLDESVTTIKRIETFLVKISDRIVYIECSKKPEKFTFNMHVKLEIVDNFIVGYEVI